MQTFTKEEFWAKLEQDGEEAVRISLKMDRYGHKSDKRALVEEWLRKKDQERSDLSNSANFRVARSAKNAAWIAAIAAMIAAICAIIPLLLK